MRRNITPEKCDGPARTVESSMRVTLDSNVWQFVVRPELVPNHPHHDDFVLTREALRTKRIEGFLSETFGTLEAFKNSAKPSYFSSIRPNVDVRTETVGNGALMSIGIGTNHGRHPGLKPILQDGLNAALSLGIRLMRAPRIGLPLPATFLHIEHFADEQDVPVSAERDNRWGEIVEAIEQRGVGPAVIRALSQALRQGATSGPSDPTKFARAVAEWADGDSVAAHIAYKNDVFCTEDKGNSAGGPSILDGNNRVWLQATYGVKFATIGELAQQIK